ncbi:MAG: hypothetical protein L0229_04260 [Blastocatellia bacterium]|nr:hypothetical protein [Blastocatellia bacterium]
MSRKLLIVAILVLLAGLGVAAAFYFYPQEAPYEDLDKATALFFHRLNAEQYDAIYDDASPYYKEANTRAAMLENLKTVKALGNHATPARIQMVFDTYKGHRIAEPVYGILFERARTLFSLRYIDEGGEWKLMGFTVKSRSGG